MSEEASQLLREAKTLQQTLKESLKSKDPWERETDFTRKQLRRNCLRLLLLHPYEPESKDAENMLWMSTSYNFIAVFKQRIAALDRVMHSGPRQQGQGQGQGQQPHGGRNSHVVEHRKLLQRFRQFLADEEKFWIQLIVRIRRIFALDDAHTVLAELGIFADEPDPATTNDGPPKRNHFQFPPDVDIAAAAPALTPASREQRDGRMASLSKALVCLGDIERYKEQYNESGGRPRAGHEDGPPAAGANGGQKSGRGRKGGAPSGGVQAPVMPRMRNYDKAQQCYQQARLLLPQDGNPAHQMAILATYQKDAFGSLVHYYRALCVRTPFDTAAENLGTVLSKALVQWKIRGAKKDRDKGNEIARGDGPPMAPRLRVEAFKEKLIVLHGLWRIPPEEANVLSPDLAYKLAEDFRSLISDRVLPLDIILKVIVLSQSALWKHRMFRSSSSGPKKGPTVASPASAESAIASHLLLMHRILLEVGLVQLAEAPPEDVGEDLAQRITAAFRRTLPALRMAGKWLRANLRYLTTQLGQYDGNNSKQRRERRRNNERRSSSVAGIVVIPGLAEFWRAYAQFSTALMHAFPADQLPALATTLEEDVELAGFVPLKSKEGARDGPVATNGMGPSMVPLEQVHPNEEQLMRISDLLADAQAIAEDEVSTFLHHEESSRDVSTTPPEAQVPPPARRAKSSNPSQQSTTIPTRIPHQAPPIETDEDNMTDITRTEDDPVEAAFRTVLNASDDDDDEIIWNPGADEAYDLSPVMGADVASPTSPPRHLVASPVTVPPNLSSPEPISPKYAPKFPEHLPLAPPPVISPPTITTAQDILASVLHRSPPRLDAGRATHIRQVSAPHVPQTHMLFGSSALGTGPSIWSSNANETAALHLNQGFSGSTQYQPQPQSPPQLQYSSHNAAPPHSAHTSLGLGHGMAGLGSMQQFGGSPYGHQRVQSLSTSRSPFSQGQLGSSHTQSHSSQLSDPFGSYPVLTDHAPVGYNSGVPGSYADPVYTRKLDPPSQFRQTAPGIPSPPSRSVPYHFDPRPPAGNQEYAPLSSMAQLWNNSG
ncbi:uncharacterized protein BXZ73DRAFT_89259 [Epithele typhae]|uniref:uncharacterized protein n=1 Tax=Epithele typhae TaxID=378194 RepID=UPI0020083D6B|nr:uncharacterized protein BXZ73DRAFT_89259 [Epithele typhae]KAH9937843.1 hypothetical protein BXZ73DRAFT_89259 [Epithele typhae]